MFDSVWADLVLHICPWNFEKPMDTLMAARTACARHLVCIYSGPDRGLKQLEWEQVVNCNLADLACSVNRVKQWGFDQKWHWIQFEIRMFEAVEGQCFFLAAAECPTVDWLEALVSQNTTLCCDIESCLNSKHNQILKSLGTQCHTMPQPEIYKETSQRVPAAICWVSVC